MCKAILQKQKTQIFQGQQTYNMQKEQVDKLQKDYSINLEFLTDMAADIMKAAIRRDYSTEYGITIFYAPHMKILRVTVRPDKTPYSMPIKEITIDLKDYSKGPSIGLTLQELFIASEGKCETARKDFDYLKNLK